MDLFCLTLINLSIMNVYHRKTVVLIFGKSGFFKIKFSKRYHHGCGGHPELKEQQEIAAELSGAIKKVMNW